MDQPDPLHPPAPAGPPAAPVRPPWQRAARAASIAAGAAAVITGFGVAGIMALWRSEPGSRWLLQQVPGLTAVDVSGSLGGHDLRIGSLRVVDTGVQVDARALHLAGLRLHWHPHAGAWLGVSFE